MAYINPQLPHSISINSICLTYLHCIIELRYGVLSILTTCVIMALALALPSLAQDSPLDFLRAHNAARSRVGVGPLTWNTTLAPYAQYYANQRINDCSLVLSNGPYGENLVSSTGDYSGVDAVKLWVDEGAYYDYSSNSCAAPAGKDCLSYTQVVWRNSVLLGCAKVRCITGGTFIVCSYYPRGNIIGQWPY